MNDEPATKGALCAKRDLLTEKKTVGTFRFTWAVLAHEMNLILLSQWRTDFPRVNAPLLQCILRALAK
jgi:hypothetical protein